MPHSNTPSADSIVYCGRAFHYVEGRTVSEVASAVSHAIADNQPFVAFATQFGPTVMNVDDISVIRPATEREAREHAGNGHRTPVTREATQPRGSSVRTASTARY